MLTLPALIVLAGTLAPADTTASNNKGKLEGTYWVARENTLKGKVIPAGSMKLTFRQDGTMLYQTGERFFTGRFELGKQDEVIFALDQKLAGRQRHNERIRVQDARLTLIDSDGTTFTFDKREPVSVNLGKIENTRWSVRASTVQGKTVAQGTLKLAFGKDGSLVYQIAQQTYSGFYSLEGGDVVLFRLDRALAGRNLHTQRIVIDARQLTLVDSDGTTLPFERAGLLR